MKTLVLGWDNTAGAGTPVLVCAPTSSQQEQINVMQAAKASHVFPKGIKRISFCRVEEVEHAEFISEDLVKAFKSADEAKAERLKKEKAEQEAKAKADKVKTDAHDNFQKAVSERNRLLGRKNAIEVRLRNMALAATAGIANGSKKEADDLNKELADLAPKIETAVKDADAKQKALADLQSPKEQVESKGKNKLNF